MNPAILISGTNTEVGKTRIITALAAYWLKHNSPQGLGLIKLIQTGVGDFQYYQELFRQPDLHLEILAPLVFTAPLAPPLSAAYEGREINLAHLWQVFSALRESKALVLAEGVGGLGSPITEELTVADLAAAWHLATVLVAPVQLGAIAQIVANVALARQTGVSLLGIILNCSSPVSEREMAEWTPIDLIVRLTQTPVIGYFPYVVVEESTNLARLAELASHLDLEYLYKMLR